MIHSAFSNETEPSALTSMSLESGANLKHVTMFISKMLLLPELDGHTHAGPQLGQSVIQVDGGLVDYVAAQAVGQGRDIADVPADGLVQGLNQYRNGLSYTDHGDVALAQIGGLHLQMAQVGQHQDRSEEHTSELQSRP